MQSVLCFVLILCFFNAEARWVNGRRWEPQPPLDDHKEHQDVIQEQEQQQRITSTEELKSMLSSLLLNELPGGQDQHQQQQQQPQQQQQQQQQHQQQPQQQEHLPQAVNKRSKNGKRIQSSGSPLEFGGDGKKSQDLSLLIAAWEAKLMSFAQRFSETPELLDGNPVWIRLLQVRDSLRKLQSVAAIDQTRM